MASYMMSLALVPHWIVAGIAGASLIVFSSIRCSIYIVFQQELVSEHWRRTMSSALTMAYGISTAGISLGGGWLIDTLDYRALFLSSSLITAFGVLYFHIYFRKPRDEYTKNQPEHSPNRPNLKNQSL